MLTVEEIRTFIEADKCSKKKQLAMVGQRYYEGQHDILKKRIFFFNADGVLEEEKTKVNTKIPHPFFRELVDQAVQYLLSCNDGFIRSDDPDLQSELDDYFNENEDFIAELNEILTGSIVKGFEYAYAFKGEDGKTHFQAADSLGVVEVRAKETADQCEYLIYWYIDRFDKDSRAINRIQVWDKTQTWFYTQIEDGEITPDESEKDNPRPHTLYQKGEKLYMDSYGEIPFIRLDNNRKQRSDIATIKSMIDDYDVMNCGLSNNIEDTNEALYVVTGFDGDNLDELMKNIRAKKVVGVGEGGNVNVQTVDIPIEARKAKMETDEKNIFRFGMGVNMESLKDTGATVSIAIKAAYSLLDLKCNMLEIRLKQFMRRMLKIVLAEINHDNGTDYQQSDVYFCFKRETIVNEAEQATIELTKAQRRAAEINTILSLASTLDDETRLKLICEQLEIDYDEIKDKVPKEDETGLPLYQVQNELDNANLEE